MSTLVQLLADRFPRVHQAALVLLASDTQMPAPAAHGQPAPRRAYRDDMGLDDPEPGALTHPVAVTDVQDIPLFPMLGWRLESVVSANVSFKSGQMFWPWTLHHAMLADPVFSHGVETRIIQALAVEFEWQKHPEMSQALFDEWVDRWSDAFDENELASSMRQRICLGVVPAHCSSTQDRKGRWFYRKISCKETGNLFYYPIEERYKIVTLREGQQTVDDDAQPWILFKERSSSYPHLYGASLSLSDHWWLKQEAVQLRSNYGRYCGQPVKKITTPVEQRNPQEGTPDTKSFLRRAKTLLGGGIFQALQQIVGDKIQRMWDLEFVEADGQAAVVFDKIIDGADDVMTLKLLGATDNTRGGNAGSEARSKTHEKQTNKYLASDCKLTARQQYRLAREWCRFNRLPEMLAPRPCYHVEPPADKKELADANSANASAIDKITSNLDALELRLRKQDPTANIDIRKLLLDHGLSLVEPGGDEPSSPGLEE